MTASESGDAANPPGEESPPDEARPEESPPDEARPEAGRPQSGSREVVRPAELSGEPAPPGRPQLGPYVVRCAPGKYAYCRCQRSARFPYCDGTHRGSDVTPLKLVLAEQVTVAWCCCGRSRNLPFCDGSHTRGGEPRPPVPV